MHIRWPKQREEDPRSINKPNGVKELHSRGGSEARLQHTQNKTHQNKKIPTRLSNFQKSRIVQK